MQSLRYTTLGETGVENRAMFVVLGSNDQAVCLLAALDKQTEDVWEDAERLESTVCSFAECFYIQET